MAGKTILILGGGVGGIVTANALRQRLGPEHRVVVVDKRAEYVFTPSLLWVMVGWRKAAQITKDLRRLLQPGVEVRRAVVQEIDPEHPGQADRREIAGKLVSGELRGYVVIPQDFERHFAETGQPLVQIITDGSQPNTANFVANYAQGVVQTWMASLTETMPMPAVQLEPRYWFNPELASRRALVPGAIAIIMTIIGTLLTALVVAREWERGTMEAILSTPASVLEILVGKLLPYFVLGMLSTLIAAALAVFLFNVPLRGSLFALLVLSAVFMMPALGQGLLISSLARNQFLASQLALFSGYLPAFMLSGFLFEIDAMPAPIRAITWLIPARYFVSSLKTIFLAGDVWSVFLPDLLGMATIGLIFFLIAQRYTRKSLE